MGGWEPALFDKAMVGLLSGALGRPLISTNTLIDHITIRGLVGLYLDNGSGRRTAPCSIR